MGLAGGTLLDVGAGVGSLTFELLARGIDRLVIVEASAGYAAVASDEAARRYYTRRIDFVRGDFLDVARVAGGVLAARGRQALRLHRPRWPSLRE